MVVAAPDPTIQVPEPLDPHPYRLSREDFLRMGETGVFGDRRFELLEGELYEIMGQNRPHRTSVRFTVQALRAVFGEDRYAVDADMEIPLDRSQPRPDVLVLRGSARELADREEEEGPDDVALIVEVVDTRADTAAIKRGVYARAGVPEYWIVDVNARKLTIHRDPAPDGYQSVQILRDHQRVAPLEPGIAEVSVLDLLPPVRKG